MRTLRLAVALAAVVAVAGSAAASDVGRVAGTEVSAQALRFLSLRDPAVRYAVAGVVLMGLGCGVLGGFVVVRRMSLVGDALSHAVLPGVALGFLWNLSKDPVAIFVGATVAGLAGTGVVRALTATTRLKEDTALGLVLASFFALGACLVTMIQRLPTGSKSGLDKFLFGQAAAIGREDVVLMAVVTALVLALVFLFYKELLVSSFDRAFAGASGVPVAWVERGLMLLLAFTVVIALQAVGAVLVSALLITPAAAASLLTERLHRLLLLSAALGVLAGLAGAFLSFLGSGLPTGPLIVLSAGTVFAGAFLFAPRHGLLARAWRRRSRAARVGRENTLKALYRIGEDAGSPDAGVTVGELAARRRVGDAGARHEAAALVSHGLASLDGDRIHFTPPGRRRAAEIVRNHRLWELYLANSANVPADHVHEDAEAIEHVLGEAEVRELERRLNYAARDPHGRPIPSVGDIHRPGEGGRP